MKRILVALSVLALLAVPVFAQATFRATLSWTEGVCPTCAPEDGFRIERSPNDTPRVWATVGTVAADVLSYVDEPIQPGDDLCWRVFAFNVAGDSLPSNEACGAAPSAPASPGGFTVVITQAP